MAGLAPAPLPSLSGVLEAAVSSSSIDNPAPLPHLSLTFVPVTGDYDLIADAGAFTLSGQDAALNRGALMVSAVGAFTLSGQDATLTENTLGGSEFPGYLPHIGNLLTGTTGVYTIPCTAGSFAVSGGNVTTLRKGVAVVAEAGAFVVTGAPAERDLEMDVLVGSFVVTGVDAAMTRTYTALAADATSFVVNGEFAGLTYNSNPGNDYILTCNPGTYAMTGVDAGRQANFILSAEKAYIDLIGWAAAFDPPAPESVGAFRGAAGPYSDDDDDPWWMRIPKRVADVVEEVAKDSELDESEAQRVLRKEVALRDEPWQNDYGLALEAFKARGLQKWPDPPKLPPVDIEQEETISAQDEIIDEMASVLIAQEDKIKQQQKRENRLRMLLLMKL